MSYTDYIAHTVVKPALDADGYLSEGVLSGITKVKMDKAESGYIQSSKRFMEVMDINGREYRITIEDITN
jgi:hypothetical protein